MNHKKLLKFFAAAVVLCLALTGQVFADSPTASAGVSVKGKVTSYLPGVGCTVQLVQGGEVKYSTVIYSNAGHAAQEFAIPGVASGIYDLVITKPGHLSYTVKDIVVGDSDIDLTSSSNEQIANITLVAGDINGDGCVDLQDVTIITSTANYGQKPVEIGYEGEPEDDPVDNPVDLTGLEDFYYEITEDGIKITGVKDKTKTEYIIPNTVTSIGKGTFEGCTNLTGITIPNGVTSIELCAFQNCTSLTSITLPDSLTNIGTAAFQNCTGLTDITLPDSLTNIGKSAFWSCTGLASVTIPNNVTSLGEGAFYGCTGLTSITIPDSVTSIGGGAFNNCTGLTSITIPESVTSIGKYAFYNCTTLENITIPNDVTSIGGSAFQNCTGLTSITIPDSVTSIGASVFSGCTNLESITLPFVGETRDGTENTHFGYIFGASAYASNNSFVPASLKSVAVTDATSIGECAFYNCTSLRSITIPNSVTSIGWNAFYKCESLNSITLPFVGTTKGGTSNTHFCCIFGESSSHIPTSLKTVVITDGTSIGNYVFSDCMSLTSITIPDSVTSIGNYAFKGCTGLTSITYGGTKSQWEAITKGTDWDYGTGNYTITYNYTGE